MWPYTQVDSLPNLLLGLKIHQDVSTASQPHHSRIQPRSLHHPRRSRLLSLHFIVRILSRSAHLSLRRLGEVEADRSCSHPEVSAEPEWDWDPGRRVCCNVAVSQRGFLPGNEQCVCPGGRSDVTLDRRGELHLYKA